MVKVSVIIPVYNVENYIGECLESLCRQTLKEIEIICVDDGSTDASPEILREFREKDSRIQVVTQKNLYAGAARNNGLKEASGEYVVFLDGDDFFADTLLEKIYLQGKSQDADIVLFGAKQYNQKSGVTADAPWYFKREKLPKENPFSRKTEGVDILRIMTPAPWTKCFKRSFIEEEKLQFQGLQNSNDVYFVLTALCAAERITWVNEDLVFYRVGLMNNLQSSKRENPLCFLQAYRGVYDELKRRGIYEEVERSFLNSFLSGCVQNLRTVGSEDGKRRICGEMRKESFLEMGILDKPEEYFDQKEDLAFLKGMFCAYRWDIKQQNKKTSVQAVVEKKGILDFPVPKVSVVIPVYNVERYLGECLDSILGQTLKEIEVICVNDGSTDGSMEILREKAGKDNRITLMNQENAGASAARNNGVKKASGKYLYFMDSDDILEKNALERLYTCAEENSLDILYFDGESFFETEELKEQKQNYITYYIRTGDYSHVMSGMEMLGKMLGNDEYRVSPCLQFLNLDYYRRKNLSFREGIVAEDNIFTFRSIMGAERVYHIKDRLFRRRVRQNSVMTVGAGFDQVYGLFAGYLEVENAFRNSDPDFEGEEILAKLLDARLRVTRSTYHQLDAESKWTFDAMDFREKMYFQMMVKEYDDAVCRQKELLGKYKQVCSDKTQRGLEIRGLRQEKQEQRKEIQRQAKEIQSLEKQKEQLTGQKAQLTKQKEELIKQKEELSKQKEQLTKQKEELTKQKAQLTEKNAALDAKIASLKASVSYRLGRGLTKPFRWLKQKLKYKK